MARLTMLALLLFGRAGMEYRDLLWSQKPYAPNPGRDVRLTTACRF